MVLPEQVRPVSNDFLVKLVVSGIGSVERWVSSNHNEQNHSRSEQIHLVSMVGLSHDDLRSHISKGSQSCLEGEITALSAHRGGKAEVGNLQGEVLVKE